MNLKISKVYVFFMVVPYVLLYTSCSSLIPPTSATVSGPRTIIINTETINEEDSGGFITWLCTDYFDERKILFEVGFFVDSTYNGLGFILFDDGYSGEFTAYERTGLEHRWDWGPNGNDYAFVIKPDGTGLYYSFRESGTAKASSIYKCYQRKTYFKNTENI